MNFLETIADAISPEDRVKRLIEKANEAFAVRDTFSFDELDVSFQTIVKAEERLKTVRKFPMWKAKTASLTSQIQLCKAAKESFREALIQKLEKKLESDWKAEFESVHLEFPGYERDYFNKYVYAYNQYVYAGQINVEYLTIPDIFPATKRYAAFIERAYARFSLDAFFRTEPIYQPKKTANNESSIYSKKFYEILETDNIILRKSDMTDTEFEQAYKKANPNDGLKDPRIAELDSKYVNSAEDAERFNKIKLLVIRRWIQKKTRQLKIDSKDMYSVTAYLRQYGFELTANEFFEIRLSDKTEHIIESTAGIYLSKDELLKMVRSQQTSTQRTAYRTTRI